MMIQDFITPKDRPTAFSDLSLIAELYIRGITIEDVFARYFEFDVHAIQLDDELKAQLTVSDVLKYAKPKEKVKEGKVF